MPRKTKQKPEKVKQELPKEELDKVVNHLVVENSTYWIKRKLSDKRRDWGYNEENWVKDYVKSVDHPHRQAIVEQIKKVGEFNSILEIGCNAGPNLKLISQTFPGKVIYGTDINEDSLAELVKNLPEAQYGQFNIENDLPWSDKSFDIVLTDAVLIYVSPDKIKKVIKEIVRLAKKTVILVEWFNKSKLGVEKYHHWARDYEELLKDEGVMSIETIKIEEEQWPTESWSKIGYIFVAHLQ